MNRSTTVVVRLWWSIWLEPAHPALGVPADVTAVDVDLQRGRLSFLARREQVLDAAHDGVVVCRHELDHLTASIGDLHQHQLHVVDVVDATTQLIIEATVSYPT